MKVKDRIKEFCKAEGLAISGFEKTIGAANGYVNAISKSIGLDYLNTIVEKYPKLSIEWLLTGKGEMLLSTRACACDTIELSTADDPNAIPLVEPTAAAGYGTNIFAIEKSDIKDYYVVPKFARAHVDFMIEVSGDSMVPHFHPGDIVACSVIRDSSFIQWNRCHVIATRDQGILVKRIQPSEHNECIQAVSDNAAYAPFDIPRGEITALALIIGSIHSE